MKTLLVVAAETSGAQAIKAALDSRRYRVVHMENLAAAEPLLVRNAIDLALLDVELTDVRAIRAIRDFKQLAPGCPLFVVAKNRQWEWEEDAYLQGVARVLSKPIRAELLNSFIERELAQAGPPQVQQRLVEQNTVAVSPASRLSLESLRDFSNVLTHSLETQGLLREFLRKLREALGVNRAVIFLRKPAQLLQGEQPEHSLKPACAIGIEDALVAHLALSLSEGIGGYLRREGRILRADSAEATQDPEVIKEFQLIGARVAIPILDRQSLIGAAVFDQRMTGEGFGSDELALIFHTLEELGLAIKNSWLHDQLLENHAMVAGILGQLDSGCVVISESMDVLHANAAAKRVFGRDPRHELEFADLPQELGSKVFSVLKSATAVAPFKYQFPHDPEAEYQVSVAPFESENTSNARAALLLVEDVTQQKRSRRLEIEASELRLLRTMAERLAHEINNALTPISTHQQLLGQKYDDSDFRKSFSEALAGSVRRITRFADQLVALTQDAGEHKERVPVAQVITDAFREAHTHQHGKLAQLDFDADEKQWFLKGNERALYHAFSEILLNALQANPSDPHVAVRIDGPDPEDERKEIRIDISDAGRGFSKETAHRATEPFFTTRNVGVGLGLTVARKIVENHQGRIEIPIAKSGERGLVRVWLPLEPET